MKKIMVFGTFDILHPGHVSFLKQAKKYGNYLIAVVARDVTVQKVKGKLPLNSELLRKKNLEGLGISDKIILGDLKDKYLNVKKEKPNVICLGYDQKAFTDKLTTKIKEFGFEARIVRLKPYKENIYKSSKLRGQDVGH